MAKKKITETGPVGLQGIRNSDLYNRLNTLSNTGNEAATRLLQGLAIDDIAPLGKYDADKVSYHNAVPHEPNDTWSTLGQSKYDNPIIIGSNPDSVNEIRYENQPWYDALANGIGKMMGTAATTFMSSLFALPYGLGKQIVGAASGNGWDWSGIWDNEISQALSSVDDWMKENMVTYKSKAQQESPWWSWDNLSSMSFWADDVLANMGFTLGAAASMAVGSGTLGLLGKAMRITGEASKAGNVARNIVSSLYSATCEGMIEAKHGVDEWSKLERKKLEDTLAPEREALRLEFEQIEAEYEANRGRGLVRTPEGGAQDPAYLRRQERLAELEAKRQEYQKKLDAGYAQIAEEGLNMGNTILAGNQVLLTAGNLIQFSKLMNKSFDNARHLARGVNKMEKPSLASATRVSDRLEDGYKLHGKKLGRTVAATKGILTESSEEMNQQWIQSGAGAYWDKDDANDYWKARLDNDSAKETADGLYAIGDAISEGFRKSWGDPDQWEQFVIGGLTGAMGSYAPTKLFNQDKTKSRWNPLRYGEWSGGAIKEVKDFNRKYGVFEENINALNERVKEADFKDRVKDFVAHTYEQKKKDKAAEDGDKKAWKDADDKQTVADIQAFLRAGKLDDLREIYRSALDDMSDDEIDGIVRRTTKEVTANEEINEYNKKIDEQINQHRERINEIKESDEYKGDSKSFGDALDAIGNKLSSWFYPKSTRYWNEQEGIESEDAEDANRERISKRAQKKIDKEEAAIAKLEADKQAFAEMAKGHYEGPYVDAQGNRTKSNDAIRKEMRHNAEELNRKVDSYLESIKTVNERTNGKLSKEQDDELAYLHHIGKEKLNRLYKIMGKIRKQLPKKFLLKTEESLEALAEKYSSSDLAFSRDTNTPKGYVEVDTSRMNDKAFADFFRENILRGGNINPEFAETAEEKAAREEEEKNQSEEEHKKSRKERATKKWKDAMEKLKKDADEQQQENWNRIVDSFFEQYKTSPDSNLGDDINIFERLSQDIADSAQLYNEAGKYFKKLNEYIANPQLMDANKNKEEKKSAKEQKDKNLKEKVGGKKAKEINEDLFNGDMDISDIEEYLAMEDGEDPSIDLTKEEIKKAEEIRKKGSRLKQHIQEGLGENPTPEELNVAEEAMSRVDDAVRAAEDPDALNIDSEELGTPNLERLSIMSDDDLEDLDNQVKDVLQEAFDSLQEDEDTDNDLPDLQSEEDNTEDETPDTPAEDDETGDDPVTASDPVINNPDPPTRDADSEDASDIPVPESPLTEDALDTIIEAMKNLYESPSTAGGWRTCTTRHPYHSTFGTYHEDYAKKTFGENSIQYKRSKAIWEYLNNEGAFNRQESASKDRLKAGDTVHFAVKNLSKEIYGKEYSALTEEEKPYALVILMMDDNGNVIGDLPLAQLEPGARSSSPSKKYQDLLALQNKIFDSYNKTTGNTGRDAIVDPSLNKDNWDNLGLTFNDRRKSPLVSKIEQVMKGRIPYIKSSKNTLNDVANGAPMTLGVRSIITKGGTVVDNVATRRGEKEVNKNIVFPKVGASGQPYLLIPTPSGEQVAVPFYMATFDAQKHSHTKMYQLLANSLFYLMQRSSSQEQNKENYLAHLSVIEGLLQVRKQHDAPRLLTFTDDSVTLHLESLTNSEEKIDITVPFTGDTAAAARALVDAMTGLKCNVSLRFLNGEIEVGKDASSGNLKYNYNEVIGEIADINLPKATTHSVNGWFTISLAPEKGIMPSRRPITPRTTGTHTITIKGRSIEVNTDTLEATDPTTGEPITGDGDVALALAEIKANKPQNKGKDFIQVTVDGETRTYDVKKKKFVKKETPAEKKTKETLDKQVENAVQYLVNHPTGKVSDLMAALGVDAAGFNDIAQELNAQYGYTESGEYENLTYKMPEDWLEKKLKSGLQGAFGPDSAIGKQIKEKNKVWINTKKEDLREEWEEYVETTSGEHTAEGFLSHLQNEWAADEDLTRRFKSIQRYNKEDFDAMVEDFKAEAPVAPKNERVGYTDEEAYSEIVKYITMPGVKQPNQLAEALQGTKYVKTEGKKGKEKHTLNWYEIEQDIAKQLKSNYPNLHWEGRKEKGDIKIVLMNPEGDEVTPSILLKNLNNSAYKNWFIREEDELIVDKTSKKGNLAKGRYVRTIDSDGFTHIKHLGASGTQFYIDSFLLRNIGLDARDILGDSSDWADINSYDKALQDIEDGVVRIKAIHIRPDGSVFIETSEGFNVEEAAARKIFSTLFTKFAPVSATDETGTEEEGQNNEDLTIEEIEEVAKNLGYTNEECVDAWNAIPDSLKLKAFNEGAFIKLSTMSKSKVIAVDSEDIVETLTEFNNKARKGKLKVEEQLKKSKKEGVAISKDNEVAMRHWLAKNLPMLNKKERVQFVEKLARGGDNMWGNYKAGVIEILKNGRAGTLYHEAFHYVMDMVLDETEKQKVLKAAREELESKDDRGLSDLEVEERLADNFRRYALDKNARGITAKLKRWFIRLLDKILLYNRISDATVNQLFWKINNGEFAFSSVQEEAKTENKQRVLREIRNIQNARKAWDYLPADTRAYFEEIHLTKEEYERMSLEEKEQWIRCRG